MVMFGYKKKYSRNDMENFLEEASELSISQLMEKYGVTQNTINERKNRFQKLLGISYESKVKPVDNTYIGRITNHKIKSVVAIDVEVGDTIYDKLDGTAYNVDSVVLCEGGAEIYITRLPNRYIRERIINDKTYFRNFCKHWEDKY